MHPKKRESEYFFSSNLWSNVLLENKDLSANAFVFIVCTCNNADFAYLSQSQRKWSETDVREQKIRSLFDCKVALRL